MTARVSSPVSRCVRASGLPAAGKSLTIKADAEQRAALALEHDLVAVDTFHADLIARPFRRDGVRVTGRVEADITQNCVVTLEPLKSRIDREISALFVPEGSTRAGGDPDSGELILDAEGPDAPEPFSGDSIDLGALAEEFFELAIDPFPRRPGAEVDERATDASGGDSLGPMYESLKKLRSRG